MMALSRNDLSVIEGDARVSCTRLGEALGFAKRGNLHRLIARHKNELEDFGEVFLREEKNPSVLGGRPITTYYLNEHQAVALAMWAETPQARLARRQIVEVFVAWRHGLEAPRASDPFTAQADHLEAVCTSLERLETIAGMAQQITHLPIWSNGRRPDWWWNLELRDFLTRAHRQVPLKVALAHARRRWPHTSVSLAGIHRYWARLDTLRGVTALPRLAKPKDAA